ncbi:hypothetical protein D9758_017266 [Tetrapyrgos nigripes]|uniref:NADH:flavin oxidoreductase/NADH oxidase N-terminal domain-containing protein n=1 Tax=Tetrapyrgos nigripes TaxID=182062 RepID=A0A8H5C5R4_9AGAR|nr:hypothetical protein D9758_017266 [Tetrapyrgos nigripes]
MQTGVRVQPTLRAFINMSTATNLSSLLKPLQLGPYTTRNRIFMSALTRNRTVPTNVPNELLVEYYRQRARSAGLIVTEGVLVAQQGTEWPHAPGIWSQEQVQGWKKVTDVVHAEVSLLYSDLGDLSEHQAHCPVAGRISHPDAPEQIASGEPVYAPSAIAARGGKFRHIPGKPDTGYVTPTAIDDPKKLIALLKKAAVNAKNAGFRRCRASRSRGFLSSNSNKRTDAYGGSLENRMRFTLEVLKEVIDVWGPERVGIKLNPPGGLNDCDMPLEETVKTYSSLITDIDKLGIGYISLMRYNPMLDPLKTAAVHDVVEMYAHLIKNPKTVFIPNSGFTLEEGAQFVDKNPGSAIFYGIPWIMNPDLAKRVELGKPVAGFDKLDMLGLQGYYPPYPHDEDLMKGENLAKLKEDLKKGYSDYPDAQ